MGKDRKKDKSQEVDAYHEEEASVGDLEAHDSDSADAGDHEGDSAGDSKRSKKRDRLKREALKYQEAMQKRGVVYISRVPPHMKPNKVIFYSRIYFKMIK
jgi:ESF2/ABP1 family protein